MVSNRYVMQVANADAIELFFNVLQQASEADMLWGLAVWFRLVQGSMANVAACASVGLAKLLIDWFAASSEHPLVQIRIALVLQHVAAHNVTGSELRALFRMMQPRAGAGGRVLRHTGVVVLKMLRNMAPVRQSFTT